MNLLREVQHLYADIIAFQEMDFYKDYWVPELSKLGYESVFLCKVPIPVHRVRFRALRHLLLALLLLLLMR